MGQLQGPRVWVAGVPSREAMRGAEKLFEEIGAQNFPNSMKSINPQIQEAKRTPRRKSMKKTILRHRSKPAVKRKKERLSSKKLRQGWHVSLRIMQA